jgi:hypothetical protein
MLVVSRTPLNRCPKFVTRNWNGANQRTWFVMKIPQHYAFRDFGMPDFRTFMLLSWLIIGHFVPFDSRRFARLDPEDVHISTTISRCTTCLHYKLQQICTNLSKYMVRTLICWLQGTSIKQIRQIGIVRAQRVITVGDDFSTVMNLRVATVAVPSGTGVYALRRLYQMCSQLFKPQYKIFMRGG